jgi:hypothetical protein
VESLNHSFSVTAEIDVRKSGNVTLYYDGRRVGSGRVALIQPMPLHLARGAPARRHGAAVGGQRANSRWRPRWLPAFLS